MELFSRRRWRLLLCWWQIPKICSTCLVTFNSCLIVWPILQIVHLLQPKSSIVWRFRLPYICSKYEFVKATPEIYSLQRIKNGKCHWKAVPTYLPTYLPTYVGQETKHHLCTVGHRRQRVQAHRVFVLKYEWLWFKFLPQNLGVIKCILKSYFAVGGGVMSITGLVTINHFIYELKGSNADGRQ